MPLPRFNKLDPAKQRELLDAAAAELAEKGLDGASIAAIVERAGASKSAVYYYFEDKDDLFRTVLMDSISRAIETVGDLDPEGLAKDFWEALREKKTRIMSYFAERPVDQAIWRLSLETKDSPVNTCQNSIHCHMRQRWSAMIKIGREFGHVRDDLPEELLIDLWLAVDGTYQQFVIKKTGENGFEETVGLHAARGVELLESLFSKQRMKP